MIFVESADEQGSLNILSDDDVADSLARQIAELTGERLSEVVMLALLDRLKRERLKRGQPVSLEGTLDSIVEDYRSAPLRDARSADEIIGYDELGLPR